MAHNFRNNDWNEWQLETRQYLRVDINFLPIYILWCRPDLDGELANSRWYLATNSTGVSNPCSVSHQIHTLYTVHYRSQWCNVAFIKRPPSCVWSETISPQAFLLTHISQDLMTLSTVRGLNCAWNLSRPARIVYSTFTWLRGWGPFDDHFSAW